MSSWIDQEIHQGHFNINFESIDLTKTKIIRKKSYCECVLIGLRIDGWRAHTLFTNQLMSRFLDRLNQKFFRKNCHKTLEFDEKAFIQKKLCVFLLLIVMKNHYFNLSQKGVAQWSLQVRT